MENYASCEGQKVLYALTKQLARVLSSQQDGERLLYQLLLTDGRIKDTDDRHVEECFEKAPVTENEDFNSSHGPIVIYHAGFQKAKVSMSLHLLTSVIVLITADFKHYRRRHKAFIEG